MSSPLDEDDSTACKTCVLLAEHYEQYMVLQVKLALFSLFAFTSLMGKWIVCETIPWMKMVIYNVSCLRAFGYSCERS